MAREARSWRRRFRSCPTRTRFTCPAWTSAFRLALAAGPVPVIRVVPGQLLTRSEPQEVSRTEGCWTWGPERDVALIASIERHRALGTVGLGLVAGFNFRRHGALASSVAHDSHNVIVTGTNPARCLARCRPWRDRRRLRRRRRWAAHGPVAVACRRPAAAAP